MSIFRRLFRVNNGLQANDGSGDTLRAGADIINGNADVVTAVVNDLARVDPVKAVGNGLQVDTGAGDVLLGGAGQQNTNAQQIKTAVNALAVSQTAPTRSYLTKAAMDADLSPGDGTIALVTNDATASNNQSWRKSGAAGAGSWQITMDRLASVMGNGAGFQGVGPGAIVRDFQSSLRDLPASVRGYGAAAAGGDDTAAIQLALNSALHVVFPAGTYRINTTGLTVRAGQIVEFQAGATIKLLAHNTDTYQIFRAWDVQNVRFINVSLDGSRELNTATTGEFGMGLSIRGSTNVEVTGASIIGCWGDGIYIGDSPSAAQAFCLNVKIDKTRAYNCRRQGISVISCDGLRITDSIMDTINGTDPQAGIDFEPNSNSNVLTDIVVTNLSTRNCIGPGILTALKALAGATAKYIDITIVNHVDTGSVVSHQASGHDPSLGTIGGGVTFVTPNWKRSRENSLRARWWAAAGPSLRVIKPRIVDPNTSGGTSGRYNAVVAVYGDTTDTGSFPIGNVHVENPIIQANTTTVPAILCIQDVRGAPGVPTSVTWLDPMEVSGGAVNKNSILASATALLWGDRYGKQQVAQNGSLVFAMSHYNYRFDATGTFTLPATYVAGMPDVLITSNTTASLFVSPGSGGQFDALAVNLRWTTVQKGASIRVRPLGGQKFAVVEKVGVWTNV